MSCPQTHGHRVKAWDRSPKKVMVAPVESVLYKGFSLRHSYTEPSRSRPMQVSSLHLELLSLTPIHFSENCEFKWTLQPLPSDLDLFTTVRLNCFYKLSSPSESLSSFSPIFTSSLPPWPPLYLLACLALQGLIQLAAPIGSPPWYLPPSFAPTRWVKVPSLLSCTYLYHSSFIHAWLCVFLFL